MKHYSISDFEQLAEAMRRPYHDGYYAMYSSVYDGIVTDPVLMSVPIDDHIVHRGDGVFETMKCVDGAVYNMPAHLSRLMHSAECMKLNVPMTEEDLGGLVVECVRSGEQQNCLVRLLVSRGPGSLTVNPYDSPESQVYVVAARLVAPFMERHPEGARVITSEYVSKPPRLAIVKNCSYLLNALMKKEAVDARADFGLCYDEHGYLAEGACENMGIVTAERQLLFPSLDAILCGTTMMRVMDLARPLLKEGFLKEVGFARLDRSAIDGADEILVVGTTIDVTPVRELDGRAFPGPGGEVYGRLSALLLSDIHENDAMRTCAFSDPVK